ncbi:MAG: DUF423 domain-containing protein [Salibacteraceae bacterium]
MQKSDWAHKAIASGAVLGLLGVALGAFGAHALKNMVGTDQVESFQTAVRYQLIHALVILITGVAPPGTFGNHKWILLMFLLGIIFFCGSIYLLVLDEVMGANLSFLGPVTPLGGILLMIGWALIPFKLSAKR